MNSHPAFNFRPLPAAIIGAASHHIVQAATLFRSQLYLGILRLPADSHQAGTACILRHTIEADRWEILYECAIESRRIMHAGQYHQLPLELGFHALTVLPSSQQPTPMLYALRITLDSPAILYSNDGAQFQERSNPGAIQGRSPPFINLCGFSGKILATPASAPGRSHNPGAMLYVTDDALARPWQPACLPGLGDPENQTPDCAHVFADQLYVALGNPGGFQLWKTSGRGEPPFEWSPVLTEGAQHYTLNSHVTAMTVFKGALYLGASSSMATDTAGDRSAGAEILRILADGRWELVAGTPRFSPSGLQIPLSARGPGFGDPANRRISKLAATHDTLYAAISRDGGASDGAATPATAGFQLWKTTDGENWEPVTLNSFGCRAATELRVLLPTAQGLIAAGAWNAATDSTVTPGIWIESRR